MNRLTELQQVLAAMKVVWSLKLKLILAMLTANSVGQIREVKPEYLWHNEAYILL